jgi:acyl-CoA hydrolase
MYLIAWMDQAAAFTTIGQARSTVVTVSIDGIEFKVTIKEADIVELVVWVERVGQVASTSPGQSTGASLISEYSAYLSCF